jgi:hypothetical protein
MYLAACRQPAHRFIASPRSGSCRRSCTNIRQREPRQHLDTRTNVDGAADSDKVTYTKTREHRTCAATTAYPNGAAYTHGHDLPNGDVVAESHGDEYASTFSYQHDNRHRCHSQRPDGILRRQLPAVPLLQRKQSQPESDSERALRRR